jgi:hypothetical protein
MSTALPPRPRAWARRLCAALLLMGTGTWAAAQDVELYERADFGGMRLSMRAAAADLDSYGLGSRVSSVIVNRGQWEFCTQSNYRGACIMVGPGRYSRLPAALNDNLRSLRPVLATPPEPPRPRPPEPPQPPRPWRPDPGSQANIQLFSSEFRGRELELDDAVRDLSSRAFNDSAQSIIVRAGQWELCSDGGYSGQCLRFGPGRYALPPVLRNRLSSLRPIGGGRPGEPDRPDRPDRPDGHGDRGPWPGATAAIVFYENADFGGRRLPLAGAAPSFGPLGFNDRASAVEVFRGRWQLCQHADYQGACVVLGPGRYALNGRMHDEVSSARPLFGRDERPMRNDGGVTLHEDLNLRGRSLYIDETTANLRGQGFNDRARAIEVHGGRWELCSAAGFRGRCETFGPGWHRLPNDLAGAVSSLRPR